MFNHSALSHLWTHISTTLEVKWDLKNMRPLQSPASLASRGGNNGPIEGKRRVKHGWVLQAWCTLTLLIQPSAHCRAERTRREATQAPVTISTRSQQLRSSPLWRSPAGICPGRQRALWRSGGLRRDTHRPGRQHVLCPSNLPRCQTVRGVREADQGPDVWAHVQ